MRLWLSTGLLLFASSVHAADLIITVGQLHTGSGDTIRDARIAATNGRITAAGAASSVAAPSDVRTLRAAVATPGLIDAHTSAGLSGLRNGAAVLDQDERTDPDQSALRALDAFDPRDPLLRFLLEHGVTMVQTGPGPANPIGGGYRWNAVSPPLWSLTWLATRG